MTRGVFLKNSRLNAKTCLLASLSSKMCSDELSMVGWSSYTIKWSFNWFTYSRCTISQWFQKKFTDTHSIEFAQDAKNESISEAYSNVLQLIQFEKKKVWKSTDIHEQYTGLVGATLLWTNFMEKLAEDLKNLVLSFSGYVNWIMLKSPELSLLGINKNATAF